MFKDNSHNTSSSKEVKQSSITDFVRQNSKLAEADNNPGKSAKESGGSDKISKGEHDSSSSRSFRFLPCLTHMDDVHDPQKKDQVEEDNAQISRETQRGSSRSLGECFTNAQSDLSERSTHRSDRRLSKKEQINQLIQDNEQLQQKNQQLHEKYTQSLQRNIGWHELSKQQRNKFDHERQQLQLTIDKLQSENRELQDKKQQIEDSRNSDQRRIDNLCEMQKRLEQNLQDRDQQINQLQSENRKLIQENKFNTIFQQRSRDTIYRSFDEIEKLKIQIEDL